MSYSVLFLSIIAAMGVISSTLCAPALPFITDHFSSKIADVQFTISLFLIGNAFGQFASGPLSDRLGQKKVLMGALLLYVAASLCAALAGSMGVLIGSRFFQGMGSSVGPVLARAIAAHRFSHLRSAQVQSYNAIGIGIASILAILCAGKITLVSWRGNFFLAALLGLLLFAWTFRILPAEGGSSGRFSLRGIFSDMKAVFSSRGFLKPASCHAMSYGLMYGYIALFPFFLREIFQKNDPMKVAEYSAYMIVVYMIGAFVAGKSVLKFSLEKMVQFGILCQLLSGILLLASSGFFPFLSAMVLYNFSIGIILPLTASSALFPFTGKFVGAASSSLGLSYRMVGSVLSALIASLPLYQGKNLGLALVVLSLLSLGIYALPFFKRPLA